MAETIEAAKTGRARCGACRQPIEKGALRFGEERPSAFGEGMQWFWYHLPCAARKKPAQLRAALAAFGGDVPGRAEVLAAIAEADQAPSVFPYAEHAPTGRSTCLQCHEPIEKGALRVATEREVGMGRTGAGYLHPRCAGQYLKGEDLAAVVRNSRGLTEAEVAELRLQLTA
jgi:hypothetical protein